MRVPRRIGPSGQHAAEADKGGRSKRAASEGTVAALAAIERTVVPSPAG